MAARNQASIDAFRRDYELDERGAADAAKRADEPRTQWDLIFEMWGATGIEPWALTWAEYKRMFLGWRRQRWEFFGTLCVAVANGLLPRNDRRPWQTSDFTTLVKPAPRWRKKVKAAVSVLKAIFCDGNPPPGNKPPAKSKAAKSKRNDQREGH